MTSEETEKVSTVVYGRLLSNARLSGDGGNNSVCILLLSRLVICIYRSNLSVLPCIGLRHGVRRPLRLQGRNLVVL